MSRLDLRVSRKWESAFGPFTVFLDAHNLIGRQNISGVDVDIDEETGVPVIVEEYSPGFYATAGIIWEVR